MTYNHADFIDNLDRQSNYEQIANEVRDLGQHTVIVVTALPDESPDLSHYGKWTNSLDEHTVDRKEAILYGVYQHRSYRYITRSEKRALALATKRAAREGFNVDENSDHCAEFDVIRSGMYTDVMVWGYTVLSRDLFINYRYDSRHNYRYFTPAQTDEVKYMVQDFERIEHMLNDDWCPVYLSATVYYKGHVIAEDSCGGFESDDKTSIVDLMLQYIDIDQAKAAKIAELRNQLEVLTNE